MGGKLNLLLLGSSLGRENNGHSPLVWPSAKSFKKKREKERETEAGLLISAADGVGKFMLHTLGFKTHLAVRLDY